MTRISWKFLSLSLHQKQSLCSQIEKEFLNDVTQLLVISTRLFSPLLVLLHVPNLHFQARKPESLSITGSPLPSTPPRRISTILTHFQEIDFSMTLFLNKAQLPKDESSHKSLNNSHNFSFSSSNPSLTPPSKQHLSFFNVSATTTKKSRSADTIRIIIKNDKCFQNMMTSTWTCVSQRCHKCSFHS